MKHSVWFQLITLCAFKTLYSSYYLTSEMNSFIRISCLVSNTLPNAPFSRTVLRYNTSFDAFLFRTSFTTHSSTPKYSISSLSPPSYTRDPCQAMNKAGACTYIVYTLCVCMGVNSAFVRDSRSTLWSHNLLFNIAQNVFHIDLHACVKMLSQSTAVQQSNA